MRIGKLTNEQLDKLILSKLKHTRKEVVCSPSIGVDCAAVDLGGRLAILSTDPITGADKNLGRITVHVSCNDAAAAGAEPIGLLITLLVPPSATEEDVGRVADELVAAADEAGVEILGGHTEVTDAVTRMVTNATVLAKAGKNGILDSTHVNMGDDIVLTKHAGLEGAAIIASDYATKLDLLTDEELKTAISFFNEVSVVKEGLYAAEFGASAMHDVTEGGVLGAVWEMAEASSCGIKVYKERILVHPITQKICDILDLNPLRLISSGSMLISTKNGEELVVGLAKLGIKAAVIGKAEGINAHLSDGTKIAPPEADELYKVI